MKKLLNDANRLVPWVVAAATALTVGLSIFSLEERLLLVSASGLIVVLYWSWPRRKTRRQRLEAILGLPVISIASVVVLLFVINYDTLRVSYPENPQVASLEGTIYFHASRTPVNVLFNSFVIGQAAAITKFSKEFGPASDSPRVQLGSLTRFDSQIEISDFVRPQFVKVDYQLEKPAKLRVTATVDRVDDKQVAVVFEEKLKWLTIQSWAYSVVLLIAGLCVLWSRSRRSA